MDWHREHTDQSRILLKIELPDHVPQKYHNAIGKAVDGCLVANLGKGLSPESFQKVIVSRKKARTPGTTRGQEQSYG